jgi:hypothetical protein
VSSTIRRSQILDNPFLQLLPIHPQIYTMALTPIKVKGKGPRKKWKPPSQAMKLAIRKREALLHPEKRMHKRRKLEVRKGGAPIERLPAEVIERIFLFSENLNFPRSSHRLGLALSASGTLRELIICAFAPTWDLWLGCAQNDVRSYAGWRVDSERFGGDPKFQVTFPVLIPLSRG